MVRRGGRIAAAASSSSTLGASSRWNRSRPSSVAEGDMGSRRGAKPNNDSSAKSSPNSARSRGSSPTITSSTTILAKKGPSSGGRSVRSIQWRSRGTVRNVASSVDPKFLITNEDFPELPGARVTGGGRNKEHNKKEKDVLPTGDDSPRPNSADSLGESGSSVSTTDDSGLSTSSRGNTPSSDSSNTFVAVKKIDSSTTLERFSKYDKRKIRSPNKEYSPKSPKDDNHFKNGMTRSTPPPYRSTPKKKNGNSGSGPVVTPPTYMKLSKSGQKIPERRGLPLHNRVPISPKNQKIQEQNEKVDSEDKIGPILEGFKEQLVSISEETEKMKETPKIVLVEDGVMSNIPPSMLNDQFGLAAMLPMLNYLKMKGGRHVPEISEESLSNENMQKKMFNENIEMLTIGVDLNALGVPTNNHVQKPVFESFSGPYAVQPMTPTNMGLSFHELPSVYYTARTLSSSFDMNQKMPEKLGNHELFYIFYNFPRELWQLNAARELQHRHWRFNIRDKIWIRKHGGEPDDFGLTASMWNSLSLPNQQNSDEVISGIFEVYDADKARITTRELHLLRSDIEFAAWEVSTLDEIQKTLVSMVPPEGLWGPKAGSEEKPASQAPIGTRPNAFGGNSNNSRIMNALKGIAAEQQMRSTSAGNGHRALHKVASLPNSRRLLSFADSQDQANQSMDHHSTSMNDDPLRQHMYTALFQQILQQNRNNYQSANNLAQFQT